MSADVYDRLQIEYKIELVINRQLFNEKHITYDIYEKVNAMLFKDLEKLAKKADAQSVS